MTTSIKQPSFHTISKNDVKNLMAIEEACHSHPWSEKTFSSCIGGRYFAEYARSYEKIIGFYVGEIVIDEATLMDICVTPEHQGKGYGKALLLQFISQATKQGAQKLFLEVRAKNISAQMLYINMGFSETARRTGYYPSASGFGYEDAIVMSKSLK